MNREEAVDTVVVSPESRRGVIARCGCADEHFAFAKVACTVSCGECACSTRGVFTINDETSYSSECSGRVAAV